MGSACKSTLENTWTDARPATVNTDAVRWSLQWCYTHVNPEDTDMAAHHPVGLGTGSVYALHRLMAARCCV